MFRQQIEKGAALLDEKIPEWESRQKLGLLNMKSGSCCILGWSEDVQDYWITLKRLFLLAQDERELCEIAYEHGFNIKPHDDRYGLTEEGERYYASLTEEWKKFIEERRKQKR
ncbi:MAG TPA: hypothetical protein VF974_00865 [Patescibacteria group bacterium]